MVALSGGDIGFVPTMGAFHDGHLALMREARKHHAATCVSLFVNPLQFGPHEDLAKYPRDESRDFALAQQVGVDIMFSPPTVEIYPRESTTIHVPEISERLEGKIRPGHFNGVATVVSKLFNIVQPSVAYFGWKDLQQCLVIRRMVEDLNIPVQVQFQETVREPDGLAMSSRNAYLNQEERRLAPHLYRTIASLAHSFASGCQVVDSELDSARQELTRLGFAVDYLEVVSMRDLGSTHVLEDAAIVVAAKLGTTRLIDNCRLNSS